ncbi:FAD-dependent oxidoreductase [Gordonia otitidis]|uniref:NAD(P)/FAD-dependent oxidoreductase n=1 Tax=Gordonia otitidis TaxID=249058 RepID=UPI001D14243D|nr:FAD-dependent oxidoreductase [Gordonia otitidis]UEA58021.1 FAD-dependent oxidoreductase [Gordonia otitidis]
MDADAGVVVVGGGQAGFQTAVSLRQNGFAGPVTIVEAGTSRPYQRPPLSKAYLDLTNEADDAVLEFRPDSFYERHGVQVRVGTRVSSIDRRAGAVRLDSAEVLRYGHLVLALGARPRQLSLPAIDVAGVHVLHDLDDARALRTALGAATTVVVIGGGFIGLEVAAAARRSGCSVTVVEAAPRVMGRVVSRELSEFVASAHRSKGAVVRVGSGVARLHDSNGRVAGVELTSGEVLPADLVVIGVGVEPVTDIAESAGLAVRNGILVDETLLTVDPRISAIGDCAAYPSVHAPGIVRLESVQNATDQARCVAARIAGGSVDRYAALPWFWTHQFDLNVQIAGLGGEQDDTVTVGDVAGEKFSVLRFRAGRLACVESVNSPADHMAARKILADNVFLGPTEAGRRGFTLKEFARGASVANA